MKEEEINELLDINEKEKEIIKKLFDSGSQDEDESQPQDRLDSLDNTDPPYGQYKLILLFVKPFIVS